MKVAIVSSCSLPIPAVEGGAVESLIENIVSENEKNNSLDLTVFALYGVEAQKASEKYPHTSFRYLAPRSLVVRTDQVITSAMRCFRKDIAKRNYIWKLVIIPQLKKIIAEGNFDKIVLENTIFLFNIFKDEGLREKYKGKVYFHVHNSLVKNTSIDYKSVLAGVISISDFLWPNIKEHFDKDVKIVTVHNGIDCTQFGQKLQAKEAKEIRERYNLPENHDIVIFVGRITPEKGVRELIRAFNKLKREDCELLIVGASYFGSGVKSPYEIEVLDMVNKNSRIHITGFVSKNEIWKYYAIGSVAVLPSVWDEPLGLTMIEAQAAGIPLVTTRTGGIPETVDEGCSILINKGCSLEDELVNAMNKILDNKLEWKHKAEIAQKRISNRFDMELFYKKFVKAIQ